MNVRKLMARLNPPVKKIPVGAERSRFKAGSPSLRKALELAGKYKPTEFDASGRVSSLGELAAAGGTSFTRTSGNASRGGFDPEAITALDVAHALALVKDEFARELFCHLWWPEGAARTRADLERGVHVALMHEYSQRCREDEIAKLELHLVSTNASRWRSDDLELLRKAKLRRERAAEERWVGRLDRYPILVDAVLQELAEPNHCVMCGGRGMVWAGEIARDCGGCDGSGTIAVSDRQRAEALDLALKSYQQSWMKPYRWLHRHCWQKEGHAARRIRRALLGEPAAAA